MRVGAQGGLSEASAIPIDSPQALVVAGQLDGLGTDDAALLYPGDGVLAILHNVGGPVAVASTFEPGAESGPLLAADLDRDNDLDLFTVHDLQLKVFENRGPAGFDDFVIVGAADAPVLSAAAADQDGDELPELLLSLAGAAAGIDIRRNVFAGEFEDSFEDELDRFDLTVAAEAVAVGDFDDDDRSDAVAFNLRRTGDQPDAVVVQWLGDDDFAEAPWLFMDDPIDAGIAEDMNDDGRTDLVVASSSAGTVTVHLSEL